MAYKKPVTQKDIALELGLSLNTVSKALKGMPGMSEATRMAVMETAEKRGYRSKDQERLFGMELIPLYALKSRRFAFVGHERVLTIQKHLILLGIREKLGEFGHTVEQVAPRRIAHPSEFRQWVEQCGLLYYDGVFIPPLIDPGLEACLLEFHFPRVLINFPPSLVDVDSVIWDVGTAVHLSVRHLVNLGHRRILYVGDTVGNRGFHLRWQAFQDAMREAGLEADPQRQVIGNLSDRRQTTEKIIQSLQTYRPTAILCAVMHLLDDVNKACIAAHKNIPHDCSLVSLRYPEVASFPLLSGPILLIKEAGARAAERMLWRLANPLRPYEHTFLHGTRFFAGSTVAPL
ncbi:MAG: LacI family transcriptional regulator [Paenibacillaceae bacterium]|jgi:LacI family transcriptional regulator|nr:LacI family transcriptional regulator [Paenibacillaceae bacterium]